METMRELYERVRRQEQERGRSFPDWEDDGEMDCLLHPYQGESLHSDR